MAATRSALGRHEDVTKKRHGVRFENAFDWVDHNAVFLETVENRVNVIFMFVLVA